MKLNALMVRYIVNDVNAAARESCNPRDQEIRANAKPHGNNEIDAAWMSLASSSHAF
jgi:hypothetical protein